MQFLTKFFKRANNIGINVVNNITENQHVKTIVNNSSDSFTESAKSKDDLLTIEDLHKKPFFCSLAFDHIYSDPGGLFKVCTEAYESPHNVGNTSIKDWYQSDYMRNVRKEMLSDNPDYEKLKMCSRCMEAEKNTGSSLRTRLRNFSGETMDNVNAVAKTGVNPLTNRFMNIQMRFFKNNVTCNLSCYMCFPKFSTKRQIDIKQTKGDEIIREFSLDKQTIYVPIEPIIDQFVKLGPNIRTIEVIGGEPLYIKEFFDFIEELIERTPDQCRRMFLKIFTNLTHLSLDNRDFLTYARKFDRVDFKISMDSYGKYNDYIRRNSNFDQIWSNLERVREAGHGYLVWPTISTLSVLRYAEMEELLKKNDVIYQYNLVTDPDHLNVKHLPDPIKYRLVDELYDSKDIVKALNADRNEEKFQQTMLYIRNLDKKYKTDVFELYPELKEYVRT